jgi:3-oxoacyl-[acyl-carrier protein] reductase
VSGSGQVPWADLGRLHAGDEARLDTTITRELIESTAQLTGDDNPLHLDDQAARRFGQSRPIAHGQILMGLVSRLIGTRLPGPGAIWFESEIRFLSPVYAGDVVNLVGRVAHVSSASRVVIMDVVATNQHGDEVLRGQAKVRVPEPIREAQTDMNAAERVALVTGGSRGLGRAITDALAASGIAVAINYRSDRGAAEHAVDAVRSAGGRAIAVEGALGTSGAARMLVERAHEAFGRVDIIVHAATPRIEPRVWNEITAADFHAFFDTYVVGLHELVVAAAPTMQERRFGRVIAVLSSAMSEMPPKLASYIAGKYALYALCRSLAIELGPSNITVNCVSPGMLVSEYADRAGLAAREIVARKTPLRRLGEPADVAKVVAFLASDAAAFVSGANVPVTGGIFV